MPLPDFFIIGAMKCGTSTLAAQLAAQAGIFMATPKEPNFFSDDDVFSKGIGWYQGLFEAAPLGSIKGEASTHYTKLPTYPKTVERMAAVITAPRLVYMVRDPIERAVSHFIHEWTEGRMADDPVGAFDRSPELIEYGLYAKQLGPFIEQYGLQAICLTSLERLVAAPQAELARISTHIGLTTTPVWRADLKAQNVSKDRLRKLPLHDLLITNAVATSLRRLLIPKSIRDRVRQARSYGKRPQIPADLRDRLAGRFFDDQVALRALFPDVELNPKQQLVDTKV